MATKLDSATCRNTEHDEKRTKSRTRHRFRALAWSVKWYYVTSKWTVIREGYTVTSRSTTIINKCKKTIYILKSTTENMKWNFNNIWIIQEEARRNKAQMEPIQNSKAVALNPPVQSLHWMWAAERNHLKPDFRLMKKHPSFRVYQTHTWSLTKMSCSSKNGEETPCKPES